MITSQGIIIKDNFKAIAKINLHALGLAKGDNLYAVFDNDMPLNITLDQVDSDGTLRSFKIVKHSNEIDYCSRFDKIQIFANKQDCYNYLISKESTRNKSTIYLNRLIKLRDE